MVYPSLLYITTADGHTSAASSRLNWTPANLNGLVRFAERPNLVSARVPSRFKRALPKFQRKYCPKLHDWNYLGLVDVETVPLLGQPNPVHIPTSHLLEIHPNIIHPSMSRSPQWSLSLRFPHQDPIHPPLLTHTRHIPSPSHSSRFYHPHNIGWAVQII